MNDAAMSTRPVGKTRDAGWQIGVSRSMPVDVETVWEYLTSPEGLAVWLGSGVATPLVKGRSYETDDGTRGEVRSLRPLADRADHATVQVAVVPSAAGCSLRFHTERLHDGEERERMRAHWRRVVDRIEVELAATA